MYQLLRLISCRPSLIALAGLMFMNASAQERPAGQVAALIAQREAEGIVFQPIELFSPAVRPSSDEALVREAMSDGTILTPSGQGIATILARRPACFTLVLPTVHGQLDLQLARVDIFADDFVLVQASDGRAVDMPQGLHYRGIITGQPASLAAISIFEDEVMGFVSDAQGNHVLGRSNRSGNEHIYYAEHDLREPPILECATPDDGHGYTPEELELQGDNRSANCVDLYWEVNNDIYLNKGSLINTTNYITGLFNEHATLYDNDGISVLLSQLYIWDVVSPYTATSTSALLGQFQNYRNSFNGDLGHLLGYAGGGGIAAGFSGLCASNLDNSMCYSGIQSTYNTVPTYSWSVTVVTHEEGHLLGSRHTHACVWNGNGTAIDGCGPAAGYGYEGSCSGAPIPSGGGTIMSYCHLNAVGINFNNGFGPQPTAVILNNINNANCLPSCGVNCPAPSGLTAANVTFVSATLNWASAGGATSYTVQWRPSGAMNWTTIGGITGTSLPLTGLDTMTTYDFQVRTICTGGYSGFSLPASFTTPCVWGSPCNDGSALTENDRITPDCSCHGDLLANYQEIVKVVANDRGTNDHFGGRLAINGDYAIMGVPDEDENASGGNTMTSAGSAYIFVRNGNTWVQQQKLVASDRTGGNQFGISVSINGDYAIVGSDNNTDANGANPISVAGAAYIFVRSGGTWTQQQKVVAADRGQQDMFGRAVAISGDCAVVGAQQEDEDASGGATLSSAGSAYVFARNGSTWTQQQKIIASDRGEFDFFGSSVAIEGDHAVVGAYAEDEDASGSNTASGAGSAYIFVRNGSAWSQQQKIVAVDRAGGDRFGEVLAISGDRVLVGTSAEDEDVTGGNTLSQAGSAYIFVRNGNTWSQEQKIVASDRGPGDQFGGSVAIDGQRLIVSARYDGTDATGGAQATHAGSAYIFIRNGGSWAQLQKINASDRAVEDVFGFAVGISGDQLVVGAYEEDEDTTGSNYLSDAGSAYFFHTAPRTTVNMSLWLEGAYSSGLGLMNDALRTMPSFPLIEPNTAIGFTNAVGGGAKRPRLRCWLSPQPGPWWIGCIWSCGAASIPPASSPPGTHLSCAMEVWWRTMVSHRSRSPWLRATSTSPCATATISA